MSELQLKRLRVLEYFIGMGTGMSVMLFGLGADYGNPLLIGLGIVGMLCGLVWSLARF